MRRVFQIFRMFHHQQKVLIIRYIECRQLFKFEMYTLPPKYKLPIQYYLLAGTHAL